MAMTHGLLFLLLALVAPAVNGVDHTVGGSDGWNETADLYTWAAGENFTVGDNLVFSYGPPHSLDIVSKDDYDNCTKGNALKTYNGGQNTVPLPKAGPMFFICPASNHCSSGMKIAITVSASATTTNIKSDKGVVNGQFGNFNRVMAGFALLVAGLVSFMG